MSTTGKLAVAAACAMCLALPMLVFAGQGAPPKVQLPSATRPAAPGGTAPVVPEDYTIGLGDVLQITFWREPDLSGEVVVRPDGKITVPLIRDVMALSMTTKQLQTELETAARKYIQEPNVTITVRTINSRQVFIMGNVARPGSYPIVGAMTVLQLLAQAGGVQEFADSENIMIMRTDGGKPSSFKFNYKDFVKRKNLSQNIELRRGDTVIVP